MRAKALISHRLINKRLDITTFFTFEFGNWHSAKGVNQMEIKIKKRETLFSTRKNYISNVQRDKIISRFPVSLKVKCVSLSSATETDRCLSAGAIQWRCCITSTCKNVCLVSRRSTRNRHAASRLCQSNPPRQSQMNRETSTFGWFANRLLSDGWKSIDGDFKKRGRLLRYDGLLERDDVLWRIAQNFESSRPTRVAVTDSTTHQTCRHTTTTTTTTSLIFASGIGSVLSLRPYSFPLFFVLKKQQPSLWPAAAFFFVFGHR